MHNMMNRKSFFVTASVFNVVLKCVCVCVSTSLGKYIDSIVFPQDIMGTVANLTYFNVPLGADSED